MQNQEIINCHCATLASVLTAPIIQLEAQVQGIRGVYTAASNQFETALKPV